MKKNCYNCENYIKTKSTDGIVEEECKVLAFLIGREKACRYWSVIKNDDECDAAIRVREV